MNRSAPPATRFGSRRIGLRLQIGALAALLSTLLVVVLLGFALTAARETATQLAERDLAHEAAEATQLVAAQLNDAWRTVEQLAQQPMVANALLDSEGRDTYFRPFLERVRPALGGAAALALTDFKGRPIVTSRALSSFASSAWLEAVITDGHPHASATATPEGPELIFAFPIRYAATGTFEGALVLQADLGRWLEGLRAAIASHGRLAAIELTAQDLVLKLQLGLTEGKLIEIASAPATDPALSELRVSVRAWMPSSAYEAPLSLMSRQFWLLGLLGIVISVLASQWLARILATRIEVLARAARAPAPERSSSAELAALARVDDEVGELAGIISAQFQRLGEQRQRLERQIADTTRDLHLAQKVARTGSWTVDLSSAQLALSPQCASIISLPTKTTLRPLALMRRIDRRDRRRVIAAWRSCIDLGSCTLEFRMRSERASIWVSVRAECDTDLRSRGKRVVGTLSDITALKRSDVEMQRALAVFRNCAQAVMVTDSTGVILAVNPAFTRITGYTAAEACGRTPALLKSGRQTLDFYAAMWAGLRTKGQWEGEIWNRRKNGKHYAQWLTIAAVPNGAGEFGDFVALFSDITERKKREEDAWRLANFDALTGLPNLPLFRDRLDAALSAPVDRPQSLAVLCVGLHELSAINDRLGHDAGDAYLVEATRRLERHVGPGDSLSRRTGDEFLMMIDRRAPACGLGQLCSQVLAELEAPLILGGREIHLQAHMGAALHPRDGSSSGELIHKADLAMRVAHRANAHSARIYTSDIEADQIERDQIQLELQAAIAEGAFALHYQPAIDVASARIESVEALLRWKHREGNVVPTQEFVRAAESMGLMPELGLWSIREAAAQCAQWWQAGHPCPRLSINIRGLESEGARLIDTLRDALATSGLAPGIVTLELPEAALHRDTGAIAELLGAARELGLRLAIDDFGEAFGSAIQLQRLAVDEIKISRQLVAACTDSAASGRTIRAVLAMARELDLRVVAKGVETQIQADFLLRTGCHLMQGHHLHPPMPPGELASLLRDGIAERERCSHASSKI